MVLSAELILSSIVFHPQLNSSNCNNVTALHALSPSLPPTANAIAAFDNADEIAAVLARTPDVLVSSTATLKTPLDDEAIDADADALFAAIAPHVGAKAPAPLNPMQHANTAATRSTAGTGLTADKRRVLFAKRTRQIECSGVPRHAHARALMACQHEFLATRPLALLANRHETGVRMRKRAGGGCAVELCGSRAFIQLGSNSTMR